MGATSSVNKPPYYDSSSSNQDSSSSNRQERGVEICKKDHCIHHPIEDYLLISTQTTETRYQEGRNSLICSIDPTFLKIPCYHRYPFQDYKFLKKIGQGKFCSIYKGGYINEIVNPEKIAIKEYNIHQLPNHIYYEDLIYEINILSQLNEHPNILEIHKIYEPSSNSSSNGKNNTNAKLYVIMEYLRGGEFLDGIIHYGKYTLLDIMTIFQQVISAIYFLHSHGITYNNLIPENIILKNHYQGGGYGKRHLNIIKLVGFEKCESTCLQYRKRPLIRENQDSLFFPPETISNPINSNDEATSYFLSFQKLDKKNQIILKEANDIWCAAELFYFLIAAKLPSEKIFYQQVKDSTLFFNFSLFNFLSAFVERDCYLSWIGLGSFR